MKKLASGFLLAVVIFLIAGCEGSQPPPPPGNYVMYPADSQVVVTPQEYSYCQGEDCWSVEIINKPPLPTVTLFPPTATPFQPTVTPSVESSPTPEGPVPTVSPSRDRCIFTVGTPSIAGMRLRRNPDATSTTNIIRTMGRGETVQVAQFWTGGGYLWGQTFNNEYFVAKQNNNWWGTFDFPKVCETLSGWPGGEAPTNPLELPLRSR